MSKNNNIRVIKSNLWCKRIGYKVRERDIFINNLLIFLREGSINNHEFLFVFNDNKF